MGDVAETRRSRVYRALYLASVRNPRLAAVLTTSSIIFLVWVRWDEFLAVKDIVLVKSSFSFPFGIEVQGKDITFPAFTFLSKAALSYLLAIFILPAIEAISVYPLHRILPDIPREDIPDALRKLRDSVDLLSDSLRIDTVYFPDLRPQVAIHAQPYAQPMITKVQTQAKSGHPLRILTLTGKYLIGDREQSLLWSDIRRHQPSLEVIVLDATAEAVIRQRLRQLTNNKEPSDSAVKSYIESIDETVQVLLELKKESPDRVRILQSALPYFMHLVMFDDLVFCAAVDQGLTMDRSAWYSFKIQHSGFCFASSLVGVFDAIKSQAQEIG